MRLTPSVLLVLPLAFACTNPESSTGSSADEGWTSLFDGETTSGWHGFRQDQAPAGWQVVDGALTRVAAGGDLVSDEAFEDFVLELEWRISRGGNSGIMFRVSEDQDATYFTGPEMQVLDDAGQEELDPLHSAGSNYALHAPKGKVLMPVGEWNQVRLVVDGSHVEHWLNGLRIVEYELWSPEWRALVDASKFAAWPSYGMNERGHLALQDHGDEVAYRNIRLKHLR